MRYTQAQAKPQVPSKAVLQKSASHFLVAPEGEVAGKPLSQVPQRPPTTHHLSAQGSRPSGAGLAAPSARHQDWPPGATPPGASSQPHSTDSRRSQPSYSDPQSAPPSVSSSPSHGPEELHKALLASQGSWAKEYRASRSRSPGRRDAFDLLCQTGIVTFQEISSESQVASEHIEECAAIAREMLTHNPLAFWLSNVQTANFSFQEKLEALFTSRGMAAQQFGMQPSKSSRRNDASSDSWW